MNPHYLNGERLFEQGQSGDAIDAFQKSLAMDPHNGQAHAMMALALLDVHKLDDAIASAREAVRLAPDAPFSHYVLGHTALADGKDDQAEAAANEALRLSPTEPEFYRLLALVWASRQKWQQALESVDQGLALDPEHTASLNLRSQVLLKLRRTDESRGVAEAALASNPDDAHSHANAGWSALHNNNVKDALKHFKESLRLDPGNEWAKAGLAEALKARNPLYRLLLGFMLWMVRLDPRVRIGVIIGGYILYRIGSSYAQDNPGLAPFIWPVLIAYIVFAWMTWVGMPLADLVLRLSPYGRHALSPRQNRVSGVLGLFMLAGLGSLAAYWSTGISFFFLSSVQIAVMALITVGVMQLERAPRYKMLLAGCGALALVLAVNWVSAWMDNTALFDTTLDLFLYGFIGMMWFIALGGAGRPRNAF